MEPKILRLVIFISPRPLHHSPDLRLNYHNLACFPLSHLSQFSDSQRQRSQRVLEKSPAGHCTVWLLAVILVTILRVFTSHCMQWWACSLQHCCSPPTAELGLPCQAHCSTHVIIELLPGLLIEEFFCHRGSIIMMTVLWHDIIITLLNVFFTHVLHKTIAPFVSDRSCSPLSLLWLQNCVVVSFFDSDYKQIICLILAKVSAFVHVFVSLSLEHGQRPNSVHISVTEVWFNEAAKLPFCTNSLKLGLQFVKCNWFANTFTPKLGGFK